MFNLFQKKTTVGARVKKEGRMGVRARHAMKKNTPAVDKAPAHTKVGLRHKLRKNSKASVKPSMFQRAKMALGFGKPVSTRKM